jgi:hypothetical protein
MTAEYQLPPRASLAMRWVEAHRATRDLVAMLENDDAWSAEQIRAVAADAVHGCNVLKEALLEGGRATAKRDAEFERRLVATERAVERLKSVTKRSFAGETRRREH